MPKIERGRISGFNGMATYTAEELFAWADKLEAKKNDPANTDDPSYLQKWADKIRKLAIKKEKSRACCDQKNQSHRTKICTTELCR